jgi:two-component system, cell cycle response regulator
VVSRDTWIGASISAGTVSYPVHGTTPVELVVAADGALYCAKAQGRDRGVLADVELASPAKPEERSLMVILENVADEGDGWPSSHEHCKVVGNRAMLVALGWACRPR